MTNEPVRTYLYGILVPIIGLLVYKGVVASDEAAIWLAIAAAALGVPAVEAARSKVTPTR